MEELIIPVIYKGKEIEFTASVLKSGYDYKFKVNVNDIDILFEPDEERNYRAIINPEFLEGRNKIDAELLQAIASTLEAAGK
ncbi:hypothetical protein OCK74_26345 [Chitinophagaceae bacterium LB-8]|uniref:Uncharacterized protein n=1 Tax=Paraflavisolibacter caeni TaxID=2982496 RepID=A0A9X3BKC4_9BACT|nr:hypothetical protein [Paraflavisolibacter caeni]MCU7552668.1 hypothetical protein [Paraflavisolibacter caeni]